MGHLLRAVVSAPGATVPGSYGLGSCVSPSGDVLGVNSQSMTLNGRPWLPTMGEIHYSRIPRGEWPDCLTKMKAGGIDIAAAYVFWNHHEEIQGQSTWTGDLDLRAFLQECQKIGLYSAVRLGPWCHGESRYGGFPDWVQSADFWEDSKAFRSRGRHPELLDLVRPHYRRIAEQLQGLQWKEGGPVLAVQVDNECWEPEYLASLKAIAREEGIDVPFTTMTGWNSVPLPKEGLLPLFGGYADGFWFESQSETDKVFWFTTARDDGDLGAIDGRIVNTRPDRQAEIERFPYLCCEIGGGMISSADSRIDLSPQEVAALGWAKLGSGSVLNGFYMHHGGRNPHGRLTPLNETKATGYPNDLPQIDYDFGAPLGACSQAREHWHLLRRQSLFTGTVGEKLATMPATVPPAESSLSWSVRTDGSSGFLFYSRFLRGQDASQTWEGRFEIQLPHGTVTLPEEKVNLPGGEFGVFAWNLELAGLLFQTLTCQPLAVIEGSSRRVLILGENKGVRAEAILVSQDQTPKKLELNLGLMRSTTVTAGDGIAVDVYLLPSWEADHLGVYRVGASDFAIISQDAIFPSEQGPLCLESYEEERPDMWLLDGERGDFVPFQMGEDRTEWTKAELHSQRSAEPGRDFNPVVEEDWAGAAEWEIQLDPRTSHESILEIDYRGSALRLLAGGRMVTDHFWNGRPLQTALWRVPFDCFKNMTVQVLPWPANSPRIPPQAAAPYAGEAALVSVTAKVRRRINFNPQRLLYDLNRD